MLFEFLIALLHVFVAFFLCFFFCKIWIKTARKNRLVGKDMNKYKKTSVAEAGGIAVILSIVFSIALYIFFKTFILKSLTNLVEILTFIVTILLACFIGFVDDILGWKKGLRQWQKPLLTIPIAIPLMVINAGHSSMALPFLGSVNFGLIYPLVLVPIAVIGCTNGVNMLAGFNGLEAGLSVIVFSALGLISFYHNHLWLTLLAFIIVSSLLAFLIFNRFPSRLFPGDSLTYPLGAMVACFAVLGNMEKPALLLFIPYIVEACLKARSKFKAETFGKPNKDNSLDMPYKKVYSLTHIAIAFLKKTKKKAYEKDIVRLLLLLELIIATLVLASYL